MVDDAEALADELNDLVATETRSLARHLRDARPYLTAKTYRVWRDVEHMGETSETHSQRLQAILDRLRLRSRAASYPSVVAYSHYVSLPTLLPLLIAEKRRQVESYTRAIEHLGPEGDAAATRELTALREENREQLARLESMRQTLAP